MKDANFFIHLYDGVSNFRDFRKRLEEVSRDRWEELGYPDRHKLIGDLFEIFAEIFFMNFSADNRIGVNGYTPVKASEDMGVDGYGKGINGQPVTVQVKWRSSPTHELVSEELKQFGLQSVLEFNVSRKDKDMIVFTSGAGVHWHTETRVYKGTIREINGKSISGMIDNNYGFWNNTSAMITLSQEEVLG